MPDTLSEILILLVFGTFLGIANYAVDRNRYGARIAREKIPEDVLLGVLLIGFISLNGPARSDLQNFIIAIILMTCTVLLWITVIVLALRRPQTGKVLLKLGRLDKDSVWMGFLLGALGLGFLLFSLNRPQSSMESAEGLSIVILAWSAGIIMAVAGRKEYLVTENGIQAGYTHFQWEDVKYYLWSDENKSDHYLFFKLKHRPVLLNTSLMKIPEEHRQALNDLIRHYAAGNDGRLATELRA